VGADPIARALQPSNFNFVIGIVKDTRVSAVFFGFVPKAVWGFIRGELGESVIETPLKLNPCGLAVSRIAGAAKVVGLPWRLIVEERKIVDVSDRFCFRSYGPWKEDDGGVLCA
jgi:hypothetical protein